MSDVLDLSQIWELQERFQQLVDDKFSDDRIGRSKEFSLALVDEIGDFLRAIRYKVHRKEPLDDIERGNVVEEIIDIFKYWLILCQVWGVTPNEFCREFTRKSEVVLQRFIQEWQFEGLKNIVLVDIDGVIADHESGFRDFLLEEGHLVPDGAIVNFDTASNLGIPLEHYVILKEKYRSTGYERRIPPFPEASSALGLLRDKGFSIVLLSARPYNKHKRVFADTIEWLKGFALPFDGLFFTHNKDDFAFRMRDKISFAIDDDSVVVERYRKVIPAYLFDNKGVGLFDFVADAIRRRQSGR